MALFRQLEVMYSRAAVLAAAKALLSSSGEPRAVSVDDFRKALEASTGAKLSGYFDAWMRGSGAPLAHRPGQPTPNGRRHGEGGPRGQDPPTARRAAAPSRSGCPTPGAKAFDVR